MHAARRHHCDEMGPYKYKAHLATKTTNAKNPLNTYKNKEIH